MAFVCFSRYILVGGLVAVVLLAGCSPNGSGAATSKKAAVGKWGFDLEGMEPGVPPGDDFYRYANGAWLKKTAVPADRPIWGPMAVLEAKAEEDVKALVLELTSKQAVEGSNEQKIADFYTSFLDTKTINELGLKPFEKDLAEVAALKTHEQVASLAVRPTFSGNSPIFIAPVLDAKNPDRYVAEVVQAGLGLPNRDFYLNPSPQFAGIRDRYRRYIEKMLSLAGTSDAAAQAQKVLALETEIAKRQWPLEKRRDRSLTYNPMTKADLLKSMPDFPWDAVLASEGLEKETSFVVAESGAVNDLAKHFRTVPVQTWRSYLTLHFLSSNASILPQEFDDTHFEFFGKSIAGVQVQPERWKRAISAMSGPRGAEALGEAIGQIYVRKHFSQESKAEVTTLVHNLLDAYQQRIKNSDWMSEETRPVAIRKAQNVRIKVGYPDTWRDYSALVIKSKDAYGNRVRCSSFLWNRMTARIKAKTDRDEWGMAPQAVNAYYNASFNEIVFPAAILQAPYFDANADAAVNYGGVGAVIGHEMGHGYDDQGAKSDDTGVLRSWWKKEDEDRFRTKTSALARQFSAYEPLPGLFINGQFTSGENMGDLGGLNVALEAYRISLKGKPAPVLDGFTGEQRFFLGWAQVWRSVQREEFLRLVVTSDFHSPNEFRVNGIVPNLDTWYSAFTVPGSAKLYRRQEDRVRIW